MGDLRQRPDRPSRAERRHLVNEDADGIALGDERGDKTLPRLVENLLKGVWGRSRGIACHHVVHHSANALARTYRVVKPVAVRPLPMLWTTVCDRHRRPLFS